MPCDARSIFETNGMGFWVGYPRRSTNPGHQDGNPLHNLLDHPDMAFTERKNSLDLRLKLYDYFLI